MASAVRGVLFRRGRFESINRISAISGVWRPEPSCGLSTSLGHVLIELPSFHCHSVSALNHSNVSKTLSASLILHECRRHLHFSSFRLEQDTKSKVEQTLSLLKEEIERDARLKKKKTKALEMVPKKGIGTRVLDELKHYYHGFRLLFIDIRVSSRLLWRLMRGTILTRREREQLIRTTSDIFRLVPFLIFVIVPFMEFLLPVAVKLFPGLLPSTFKEESKEQEKIRRNLKVRIEMAKFLQDTVEEMAVQSKGKDTAVQSVELADFMKKVRRDGFTTNEELMRFSKFFADELTLDNLSLGQLRALCKIINITPVGTRQMLRFQLTLKLRELKADDRVIQREGLDALSTIELQNANRARGMRALGMPTERLKTQLQQWLELSLNEKIPPSLLLLSRTLYLPEDVSFNVRLGRVVSQLPDSISDQARLRLKEVEGSKVDNKEKLELIKSIEDAIKAERKEADVAKQLELQEEKLKKDKLDLAVEVPVTSVNVDSAPVADKTPVQPEVKSKPVEETEIAPEVLRDLERVLESTAAAHELDLKELKEDVQEYKDDMDTLTALTVLRGDRISEHKAAKLLASKVDKIIGKCETVVGNLQSEKTDLELRKTNGAANAAVNVPANSKDQKKQRIITINELLIGLKQLQRVPDDTRDQRIMEILNALDEDHDGSINIQLALEVIELIGRENMKIKPNQMRNILEMVCKEEVVEEHEKAEVAGVGKGGEDKTPEVKDAAENIDDTSKNVLKDDAKVLSDANVDVDEAVRTLATAKSGKKSVVVKKV